MDLKDITEKMKEIEGWSLHSDSISREFDFETFPRAMGFVNRVAEIAEEIQHHPEIMIAYDKVKLSLTTHDMHGLTEKDFEAAKKIDALME